MIRTGEGTQIDLPEVPADEVATQETFKVVRALKARRARVQSIESANLNRMVAKGYYRPAHARKILKSTEGLLDGQSSYIRVLDVPARGSPQALRTWTAARLNSGQLPAPGGPGSRQPKKRERVVMPWMRVNRFTRKIARKHFDASKFRWCWELSRGFSDDPAQMWPLLRASALLAYRELVAWNGNIDDAFLFIQTRRGIGEKPAARNAHEILYGRWGFERLGNHEPGPNGQVILVAPLRALLSPNGDRAAHLHPILERFANPLSAEEDGGAIRALDEGWFAKRRNLEWYPTRRAAPLRIRLHDYSPIRVRTLERVHHALEDLQVSNRVGRYLFKDQDRYAETSPSPSAQAWRSWRFGDVGVEGLEGVATGYRPQRALKLALVGIWNSLRERADHEGVARSKLQSVHLSFTTDELSLANAAVALGLRSEAQARTVRAMFDPEHPIEVKEHFFRVSGAVIESWLERDPTLISAAEARVGSGFFDMMEKWEMPFDL